MVWGGDPRGGALDRAMENHWRKHLRGGDDELTLQQYLDGFLGRPDDGDLLVAHLVGGNIVWERYGLVVPAGAALRNAFVADQGDVEPTYKPTLDPTNPVAIAENDTAAPGTSLIYSHRDHKHATPATWKATPHDILSDRHGDTTAAAVARGGIVTGQGATPKWALLAKPSLASVLSNDGTDVAWSAYTSVKAGPQGSGSLTVNQNTFTSVTFNAESWDTNAQHDNSSNTSRLTCVLAGKYHITGTIYWNAETVSTTTILVAALLKNGSFTDLEVRAAPVTSLGTYGQRLQVSGDLSLSAADYVEMQAYYDANVATTRTLALTASSLSMFWVGP